MCENSSCCIHIDKDKYDPKGKISYVIYIGKIRFIESPLTVWIKLFDVIHYDRSIRAFSFHSSDNIQSRYSMLSIKFLEDDILFNHNGTVYYFKLKPNFNQMLWFLRRTVLWWDKLYVGTFTTTANSRKVSLSILTAFKERDYIIKLLLLGFLDGNCIISTLPRGVFQILVRCFDIWNL